MNDIREGAPPWLEAAPEIALLPVKDARSPYPLTQQEQAVLFPDLPDHLARMASREGIEYQLTRGSVRQRFLSCPTNHR